MSLRDYQAKGVADLRTSLAQGFQAPVFVAPPGSGKTHVAAAIIEGAREKHKRVLFLAPRRELVYQTAEKLARNHVHFGMVMAGEARALYAPVQVACIPTLYRRGIAAQRMIMPSADLVIVDEAHLSIAKSTRAVLEHYAGKPVIGLTATPARTDGAGLGQVYDALVMGPTVADLMAQGHLVPARYFAPSKPDLEAVKLVAGDYHQGELGDVMDKAPLIGDVVTNWLRIASDRPTVVFAVNVAHSVHLCERFREVGVAAEHLDGRTPNDERQAILARLKAGTTQVIVNCDVLSYGWDCPIISCCVLARPTKSIARYIQAAGRALRPADGKTDCIIIDHSGIVDDLGFLDEPIAWSLDGKTKLAERTAEARRQEPKQISCHQCGAQFDAAPVCPACGAAVADRFAKAIETREAELAELDRAKQRRKPADWDEGQRRAFMGELLGYAAEKGYKSGWAAHQYHRRFHEWPPKDVQASAPSAMTRSYIRSRQIAQHFAKKKAEAQAA